MNEKMGYGPVNEDDLIGPDIKPHNKMDRAQLLEEVKRLQELVGNPRDPFYRVIIATEELGDRVLALGERHYAEERALEIAEDSSDLEGPIRIEIVRITGQVRDSKESTRYIHRPTGMDV